MNLVANAIKYAPAGIRDHHQRGERDRTTRSAVVAVEDRGRGIPDEYKRTVFDRFTRVDGVSRRQARASDWASTS